MASRFVSLVGVAALVSCIGAAHADAASRAGTIVREQCAVCHGARGESSSPVFPRLAGQHAEYMQRQLGDFQSGRRESATMRPIVQSLSADDIASLSAWFQTQPVHAHPVEEPALAEEGRRIFHRGNPATRVAACEICHGEDGAGTETLPRLAGQHAMYVFKQLRDFNKRVRTNDNRIMHAIASRMTEAEMKAVAAYLSGLK